MLGFCETTHHTTRPHSNSSQVSTGQVEVRMKETAVLTLSAMPPPGEGCPGQAQMGYVCGGGGGAAAVHSQLGHRHSSISSQG